MSNLVTNLKATATAVYTNQYSDFYKQIYDKAECNPFDIQSLADWEKMPIVSKADLQKVSLFDRVFLPLSECDTLRTSSGTSGAQPVFTLRNYGYHLDSLKGIVEIKGAFMVSNTMHLVEGPYRRMTPQVPVINCDMADLELGIKMLVGTPINCLDMWVHAYDLAIPLLEKYGLIEQIDVVMYYGEKMSEGQYAKLRSVFKDAVFYDTYSCSEVHNTNNFESIDDYDERYGSVLSVGPDIYPEIIDSDSGEVIRETGKVGEVILTIFETKNAPCPAVRFRTGDLGVYTEYHEEFTDRKFAVVGRAQLSTIRITGGQMQLLEFNRVINKFSEEVEHTFELHYYPSTKNRETSFELHVVAKGDLDTQKFITSFMKELRISPTRTYFDGVEQGIYTPIRCRVVESVQRVGAKKRQFIQHD